MSSATNSRPERPTLQGQRIKTRKRDEKEKYDPGGFRDSILTGISDIRHNGTGQALKNSASNSSSISDTCLDNNSIPDDNKEGQEHLNGQEELLVTKPRLEALSKFLDERGSKGKDDYRKYGEVLFDVLIAGGILAPGGTIVVDHEAARTNFCVFCVPSDDIDSIKGFANVILKLIRRYKYLEKTLEEEFKKILKFLKGFKPEERDRLAKLTGILVSGGQIPVAVLSSAIHDQSVKDGCASDFLVTVLSTWLLEKGKGEASSVWSSMKKAGMDQRIMDFFPTGKRNADHLETVFKEHGLADLLVYQKAGLGDKAKKELQAQMAELINNDCKASELLSFVTEAAAKNKMPEHEVVVLLWNSIMNNCDWNKKEELVADQAVKRLTTFTPVLKKFTQNARSELALIVRAQEFSYDNMNFLKAFSKIIQLFYKKEVVTEDVILKWYRESHSAKGRTIFLEQMKPFINWLEAAEEESDDE